MDEIKLDKLKVKTKEFVKLKDDLIMRIRVSDELIGWIEAKSTVSNVFV